MTKIIHRILGIPIYSREIDAVEKRSSLRDPSDALLKSFGLPTISGATVNEETAITLSAVWACVRILANGVAMPPLSVYKKDKKAIRLKDAEHPIHKLIHNEPNSIMGSFGWRQTMQSHAVLRGNAYSIIHRDGSNRPAELELISNPNYVDPFIYQGQLFYRVVDHKNVIPAADMFHIKGLSFDGYKGKSVLQVARETFGAGLSMENYSNSLYKTGAAKRIALEVPGILKPETKNAMSESWQNTYGGIENNNKVAILEGGVKVVDIGMNPEDAQFILSRRFSVEEVARYFGLILDLLASDNKQTYASVEQRAIDFIKWTMQPWYMTWEEEINRKLFRESEKASYYSKFSLEGLLRGDTASRMQFYKDLFYIGVINRNEIRSLEDWNAIPEGDEYYMQVNMTKTQNIGNNEEGK